MDDSTVKAPLFKVISAWILTWLASVWQVFSAIPWDMLAQFIAFVYSCALLYEWIHKKLKKRKVSSDGAN